jgi:hypothetical protein
LKRDQSFRGIYLSQLGGLSQRTNSKRIVAEPRHLRQGLTPRKISSNAQIVRPPHFKIRITRPIVPWK